MLDALCAFAVETRPDEAARHVDTLAALAARNGLRELLVRAHLHRGRLRDGDEAAEVIGAEIDNPELRGLLHRARSGRPARPGPTAHVQPLLAPGG